MGLFGLKGFKYCWRWVNVQNDAKAKIYEWQFYLQMEDFIGWIYRRCEMDNVGQILG